LSFEPDLGSSLSVFSKSNLSNLKYDHLFTSESGFKYYSVEIERIFISERQHFLFIFKKNDPEKSLESKVTSLSSALEFSKVALIISDGTGKINYVTKSFETILNRDIETIFNNTIPSVLYSHLPDKEFGRLLSAVNNKKEWNYLASFLLESGDMREVDLHLHVISDDSEEPISFILTSEDVIKEPASANVHSAASDLKRVNGSNELSQDQLKLLLEKENYFNQLRNSLLNNLSHEIRTPYTAIAGYSDIVDEFLNEGNYEAVKGIVLSVKEVLKRVLNVFSNVVELSLAESGEFKLDLVTLNCNQVLRAVYNKMNKNVCDKDVTLVLDEEKKELLINIDWVKLDKIITVLVDNAIKFTEHGKITISSFSAGNKIYISIKDTGIGIDKDKLETLIEPFAQEENGYTRSHQGAGLGLSVAYKLTKLMNGSFRIQSEKNKGTEIVISFPSVN
jgi:signal transduction histidine kinase